MNDIVERLRDRAYSFRIVDRLCEEAAEEIARLRGDLNVMRLRLEARGYTDGVSAGVGSQTAHEIASSAIICALTEDERDAVETAAHEAESHQHAERAATLRGLLERLK